MDDTEHDFPPNVNPETGEVTEPEPETETEPVQPTEQPQEGRCEAVTTAGGTEYRCSLQEAHDGEHSFQAVDADDETPSAEEVAAFTEAELNKLQGKLDAENARHRKRIAEIMGEGVDGLIDCPLCAGWIDGKIPPVQPPDEVVTAVKQALGLAANDDFQEAKHAHRCGDCAGFGCVISGSLVPGNEVISCPSCNGSGFVLNQPSLAPAGMVPAPNGAPESVTPKGLNPDDPLVAEARARGLMVMPLPALPTYDE